MKYVIALLFLFPALINLLPVVGMLSEAWLVRLYQIEIDQPDVALLLRHRALLFGIVAGFLIAAAALPELRLAATLAGLASMVSFIVFALMYETGNASLVRVAWIDVVASVSLVLGYALHRMSL